MFNWFWQLLGESKSAVFCDRERPLSAWQEYTKGAPLHICPSHCSCLHMPAAQCTPSCKSGLAAVVLHAYCIACLQRGEHQFKIMWSQSKYKLVPLLSLPTFWHKPEVDHIRWQMSAMPFKPAQQCEMSPKFTRKWQQGSWWAGQA